VTTFGGALVSGSLSQEPEEQFLMVGAMAQDSFRPRLEKFLKPGARIVSHDYPVPGWKASRVEMVEGRVSHTIYLYEIQAPKQ